MQQENWQLPTKILSLNVLNGLQLVAIEGENDDGRTSVSNAC